MEAGKKRRVVLRLAAAAGGVALTLVCAAATIGYSLSESAAPTATTPLAIEAAVTEPEEPTPVYYVPAAEVVPKGPSLIGPSQTQASPQAKWRTVPLMITNPTAMAPEKEQVVDTPEVPRSKTHQPKAPVLSDDDLRGYTASLNEINRRLQPEVQKGFALGKSGAIYAARGQFVSVLRKIALAKDAESGSKHCTTALADGLRALDEADDFVPRGDTLEAELDTLEIAASHSTPIVREAGYEEVTPHEAIALYSRYAAEKIGEAVAGEQAGSMACYGLGKAYARLEVQSDDATAGRKSAVLHRAALEAHQGNYMAANELGVWLARVGRYEQASRVLRQATDHGAPISTVYENLAKVEQKLGKKQMALAARQQSEQIARAEIANGALSERRGIEWVDAGAFRQPGSTPAQMSAAPMPTGPMLTAPMPQQAAPMPQRVVSHPHPQQRMPQQEMPQQTQLSGWQKLKQATGWSQPQSQPSATAESWRPYPNTPRQATRQSAVVR